MKKVPYSAYLQEIEPKLKQLLELLEPEYGFVSILSADTTGAAYRIGQKNKVIMEPMTCERGSVVRTVKNKRIHEYSFSSMEDPKDAAEKIHSLLRAGCYKHLFGLCLASHARRHPF